LGAGAGRGGVALGGGLLLVVRLVDSPSGLIVSVRTRFESPALLLPDGGANAFEPPLLDPPDEDGGGNPDCCGNPRGDEDGVLNSTGSSSRGMTRSVVSRTRS
jgi:hypothetical protein